MSPTNTVARPDNAKLTFGLVLKATHRDIALITRFIKTLQDVYLVYQKTTFNQLRITEEGK